MAKGMGPKKEDKKPKSIKDKRKSNNKDCGY